MNPHFGVKLVCKYKLQAIPKTKANLNVGFPLACKEFGHMYSFEIYFIDFLRNNEHFLVGNASEADFVVLPHCATYVYHLYRYRYGYGDTVEGCWKALHLTQERYLLPLIAWAKDLAVANVRLATFGLTSDTCS